MPIWRKNTLIGGLGIKYDHLTTLNIVVIL